MSEVLSSFLYSMVSYSTCIVLCSLGGQLTFLSGRFNLGLEGMMLFGAFFCLYFANLLSNLVLGLLIGIIITGMLGLFMALMNNKLKVDIYIVGLAVNMMGTGLTTFLVYLLTGSQSSIIYPTAPKLNNLHTPIIDGIPYLNQLLSNHNLLDYFAVLLCIAMFFVLRRTSFGRRLQAVGLDEAVATTRGISAARYHYYSYFLCGILCGLAGASLSLPMGIYVGGMIGMTNGRGWLAMAVIILANNNPLVILAASMLIGALSAAGAVLQSAGDFPPDVIMMLPFIGALVASLLYSMARARRKP